MYDAGAIQCNMPANTNADNINDTGICHEITLRHNRYIPPISIAIADTSPSDPPCCPISIVQ